MKKGFTLIELLVVVLIIGILSAVALPQYTMAVEKARAIEAIQNIAVMEKQLDLYLLENGMPSGDNSVDCKDFSSVELSGLDEYAETKLFYYYCRISGSGGGGDIEASRTAEGKNYTLLSTTRADNGYNTTTKTGNFYRSCVTQVNDFGRKICRQLDSLGWKYAEGEL